MAVQRLAGLEACLCWPSMQALDCHGGATNEGNDVGTKRITAQQCRDFIYFFYHINNRLININNNASSDESVVSSLVCLFVLFQAL
jgi:hypothetical protein